MPFSSTSTNFSSFNRSFGCPPPPGMDPRKGKGRLMCIKVRMLDDTVGVFHLGHKALGQALFDEVCRHLNLFESDYFGLEFLAFGNRCWLDKDKSILRQIMAAQSDARFFFSVKFYTPNPSELEEEYTRYLFALQLRRDLARGELLCNESTAALLSSYIVCFLNNGSGDSCVPVCCWIQSECGDYSSLDYPDYRYVSSGNVQFVPNQSPAFQKEVMEQHKKIIGMSPAEADFNLLETARRCDFYGIRLHSARDLEGIEQQYKETVEFIFDNRDDCKNFWKKCVEHHSFFRCPEPVESRESRKLFHRGSNFHYQGRTQKQLIDYVREHRKRREPFQRPLHRSFIHPLNTKAPIFLPIYGNQQQFQQQQQYFISDRLSESNKNRQAVENTQKLIMNITSMANQKHEHFCQKNIANQNGNLTVNSITNNTNKRSSGEEIITRENGGRKTRPKSSLACDSQHNHHHHKKHNNHHHHRHQKRESNDNSHYQLPMQRSCYGDILTDKGKENGHLKKAMPISLDNSFHQQIDPMSISLPNVLAPSSLQTDGYEFYAPIKSLSGENFHKFPQHLNDTDNNSEGSYRLSKRLNNGVNDSDQQNSSRSEIYSSSSSTVAAAQSVDPRVYQTTFTTKRVGNVIVKKVTLPGSISEPLQCSDSLSIASTSTAATTTAMRRQHLQNTKASTVHSPSPIIEGNQTKSVIPTLQEGGASSAKSFGPTGSEFTSSSACCSDYSIASSSAPASTRSSDGRRIRYAPSASCGFFSVCRNEIPVAIDYPPPIGSSNSNNIYTSGASASIIRPVLIPSTRASTSSGWNQSNTSSPSTSNFGHLGNRKPLVIRTPNIGEKVPITKTDSATNAVNNDKKENTNDHGEKQPTSLNEKNNASCGGPLPGRVICKEDLVITTDGIDIKQPTTSIKSKVVRPAIAPKPTSLINSRDNEQKENESTTETFNKLLDPLDSILKDVLSLNETLNYNTGDSLPTNTNKMRLPKAISIESEERPDLRTVHLFNNNTGQEGDDDPGTVPYTLTVREVQSGDCQRRTNQTDEGNAERLPKCEHKGRHVNKQIELVHRRRLPSQDSYSSQDHSISPTTPDSDILEYMRKRSKSGDRTFEGQQHQKHEIKRTDQRRFTQPITKKETEQESITEELKELCPDAFNKCLLETDF
uniref:FERM domain-containing protein n=1 Tax=Meloidogyne hapla TaxID=6305 RepID=A0A1I8BGH8_MELHA